MRRKAIWIGSGLFVVILLLLAVGFWWWRSGPSENFAVYLPSDTLAVVYAPDGLKTLLRYQSSNLKKVLECPEGKNVSSVVAGMTGDGLSDDIKTKIQDGQKKANDILNTFWPNLSGQSFFAVTKIDTEHAEQSSMILGFAPHSGTATFDPFWDKCKTDFQDLWKDGVSFGTAEYKGISYETVDGTGEMKTLRVCKAKVGHWVIVTFGEGALKDFVDRYQKPTPADSLSSQADYKKISGRLANGEVIFYGNIAQGCKVAQEGLEKNLLLKGNIANLTKAYEPFPAFGGKIAFDGPLLRSQWIILSPKDLRPDLGVAYQPCSFHTLTYTSEDTIFYEASQLDLKKQWDYIGKSAADPQVNQGLKTFEIMCTGAGVDLHKNVLEAVGPEICIMADWLKSDAYPSLSILTELQKPDDFKPTIDALVNLAAGAAGGPAALKDSTAGSITLKTITLPIGGIAPTFTTSGKVFGIFMGPASAQRILTKTSGPTIYDQPEFKALGSPVFEGSTGAIYLNTPRIVDRTYSYVKPMTQMAAPFLPANVSTALSKISFPDKLSFSADLGGWVMKQRVDDDAIQIDTVTGVSPVIPVCLAAGAAIGIQSSMMMHAHAAATPPVPVMPAPDMPDAPSATTNPK